MIINMLTMRRPGDNYLDATIKSLFASDWCGVPLNLILGSEDESHVETHREHCNLVKWDKKAESVQAGFSLNYARALRHDPKSDLVVCEDDIEFSRYWLARLLLAVREIPLAKYVLSLYTAHDMGDSGCQLGKHYLGYRAEFFWGTQAVYYPACVRLELARYIEEGMDRKPGDLLIAEWGTKNECIFMTNGSLVQHVGAQTTGLGKFHKAWNYVGEYGDHPAAN